MQKQKLIDFSPDKFRRMDGMSFSMYEELCTLLEISSVENSAALTAEALNRIRNIVQFIDRGHVGEAKAT